MGGNDRIPNPAPPLGQNTLSSGHRREDGPASSDEAPMVEAAQLFGRHRQVVIGHNGSRYVLRITKHGKLILNK